MSFTTVEIVKKHLMQSRIAFGRIESEPVKLEADSTVRLKYPPAKQESEKVKAKEQIKPSYEEVVFSDDNQVSLNKSELIRDTIVVASDSSLGDIYRENIDYSVDYDGGVLTRIITGNISQGAKVSVWYMPYRIYTRGVDYSFDHEKGDIRRISSGDIEAGQWVYVDYISEYAFIDDDAIANAIDEANEQVLNFIDSAYSSSSDKSLVVAETYLAISIICRIKALWVVSSGLKNSICSTWASLADHYRRDGYLFLEKFARSVGSFKSPQKA